MRISKLLGAEQVRDLFMEAVHYSQDQVAAMTKWAILKAQGKSAPKDMDKLNDAWEKIKGTPAYDNYEKIKHLIDGGRADNMIEDARQDLPWLFEKAVGEAHDSAWEYYQGMGEDGPFGYVDGWFVNWRLVNGKLTFDLAKDTEDPGAPYEADVMTSGYVQDWLKNEQKKEHSIPLQTIMGAFKKGGSGVGEEDSDTKTDEAMYQKGYRYKLVPVDSDMESLYVKHAADAGPLMREYPTLRFKTVVLRGTAKESESFTASQKEWGAKWLVMKELEGAPYYYAPKNQQDLEAMWEKFEADMVPDLGKANVKEVTDYWTGEMDALNTEVMGVVRQDLPFLFIGDAHVTNTNDYDPQQIRTTEEEKIDWDKAVRRDFDIAGLALDLKGEDWEETEPKRIDRRIFVASYDTIRNLVIQHVDEFDWEKAEKEGYGDEYIDEYADALSEAVKKEMGEHVYDSFEDGDLFLGQYEDGDLDELEKQGYKIRR